MGDHAVGFDLLGERAGRLIAAGLAMAALVLGIGLSAAPAQAGQQRIYKAPKVTKGFDIKARGSIRQIYIENAEPGSTVMLVNPRNLVIRTAKTDSFGSKVFREVRPRTGYRVIQRQGDDIASTKRIRSLKPGANPPQSFYDRQPLLKPGLNYVRMRDGVTLAMTVRLPIGKTINDGPFPTVIEHSGYAAAAPGNLLASLLGGGNDPLAPASSTVIGGALAPLLGYASVSMQMRGSGCSGGAYDLFGMPTTYDGYDAIETVAAQPWSMDKVGLAGISYSGISQMFMAGTRPPHLAAIAPMSITTDLYTGTGYPGGIFNSGFAFSWISERVDDAQPAPAGGQQWARTLINQGDEQCLENQKLRLQTLNVFDLIETNPNRTPLIFDQRSPGRWMKRINVPVFLTGQYQDEQTGGNFPTALPNLNRDPDVWINMQNGVHTDSISPSTITQWVEFMDIFIARRVPELPALFVGPSSPFSALLGGRADPIEQSDYVDLPNVAAAERAFRRDNPRVKLLMDNGAGPSGPGGLGATWQIDSDSWPPKNVRARTWYLGDDGALTPSKPARRTAERYVADPGARPSTNLASGGVNPPEPDFNWAPVADGKGLGFVSAPLAKDTVIAGGSSLKVRLKSSAPDTDLQVSLSEIRPDGKETYVQTGWLRASHRKLRKDGRNPLDIEPTHLAQDNAPLPAGRFAEVTVPIFPVVHAFRAGSKIRVTIMAPGGDRSEWEFSSIDDGSAQNTILIGGNGGGSLTLPVMVGQTAEGTPLPTAGALRAQPTRPYEAASNGG
jgi:predicted acyl esterase